MYLRPIAVSVCLAAGALLSLPISAHAVVFSLTPPGTSPTGSGSFSTFNGATLLNDFDGTAASVATYSGGQVLNPSQTGYGLANDTTNFLTTGTFYFLPASGFSNPQQAPDVTIAFNPGTQVDYFGLYAGSIDSTNSVTVNTNVGGPQTFTGSAFGSGDTYLNFIAAEGEFITSVILREVANSGGGFETDNHAFRTANSAAVPFELSPALGSLVLVAWGVGVGLQRKLKTKPELLSRLMVK